MLLMLSKKRNTLVLILDVIYLGTGVKRWNLTYCFNKILTVCAPGYSCNSGNLIITSFAIFKPYPCPCSPRPFHLFPVVIPVFVVLWMWVGGQ